MNTIMTKAEAFIWRSGRVLEQHRFAHLFLGAPAEPVARAMDAYRAADGGYAYGLEPDVRGPDSQPSTLRAAVPILAEAGLLDRATAGRLCDWLLTVTAPDGGVPNVLPTLLPYPRPPWLPVPDAPVGMILPTGDIAGPLLRHRLDHPWLAPAVAFTREAIARLASTHPYEAESAIRFLDGLAVHEDVTAAADALGDLVRQQRIVLLDRPEDAVIAPGYAPGEHHRPHDYAPAPGSVAARWFTTAEMDRSLDALAAGQDADGGWPVRWAKWAPTTEAEARPGVTLDALLTLRAWGRL
ncbi:hypothetical protein Afil01_44930 [Actinorhabdospora filicis]|uniref:Uncharacterized protein n=1 Tax=Actinorhabdospora filicis TaxID=1785913 RepID=A0A9W6WBL2_9ACTN|nr:hypothetical protein [Actinorhabdospora filicis]GLZ79686.1 hypothetical protein Afil01_44930 [Actinorhabdospora filicis]